MDGAMACPALHLCFEKLNGNLVLHLKEHQFITSQMIRLNFLYNILFTAVRVAHFKLFLACKNTSFQEDFDAAY